MLKRIRGILLPLSIFVPVFGWSVSPYQPISVEPVLEPWRWQEMTPLTGHGVLCVDEDRDGTLWFGGVGGILRYDGLQVEWLAFEDTLKRAIGVEQNRNPWCNAILCLPDGTLLTVIESKLIQWRGREWSILVSGLGNVEYNSRLFQSEDGRVWVHSANGLFVLKDDLKNPEYVLRTKAGEHSVGFCVDGKGDAWVVMNLPKSRAELIHIRMEQGSPVTEKQWGHYRIGGGGYIREAALCAEPSGKIWYVDSRGTFDIRSFDSVTEQWAVVENPDAKTGHFSLIRDRKGTIWAGGAGSLLALRGSERAFFSSVSLGLPSVPISLFEAKNGWWWIILRGGHVYKIDPDNDHFTTYLDLHFHCETAGGTRWYLKEDGGVVSFDPLVGTWLHYVNDKGLIDNIKSLFASSHGLVWAVGSDKGRAAFSVYNSGQWNMHTCPEFAALIGRGAVFEALDNTLWFGAVGDMLRDVPHAGGALQYEVKSGEPRLVRHHHPPALPYAIAHFAQTKDGGIWLGAPQLFRYDPSGQGSVTYIPELPSVYTFDIVTDAAGNLWVAKGLFGIYRMSDKGWMPYDESNGLSGKLFVSLLPLPDGTILASSEKGVSRFDGMVWAGAVLPEDFGMSSRDSFMKRSHDGSVWFNFSGRDSRSPRIAMNVDISNRFCTVQYKADKQPPDTYIGDYLTKVDSEGNVHVSWTGRDPWNNTRVEKLEYSWRLNRGAWSPFTRESGRTFLGLKSGNYRLEVRSRDSDFNIDPTPENCSFSVALPVWLQPWFIILVLLFVAGIVAFIWMRIYYHDRRMLDRAKHLEEIDRMKTGFFTNISHELNTPLHVVQGTLNRLASQSGEEDREHLVAMARRNVERMAVLVSQLLEFRKLEEGKIRIEPAERDVTTHVQECVELLRPLANSRNVELSFACERPFSGWIDPDKLGMIVSNLAGNAIKYTLAQGSVRVLLHSRKDEKLGNVLSLTVEDTGRGVNSEDLPHIFERFYRSPERTIVDGSGIGLSLTRELVELWGGAIRAESPIHDNPERPGTRFTVLLPIELGKICNQNTIKQVDSIIR